MHGVPEESPGAASQPSGSKLPRHNEYAKG